MPLGSQACLWDGDTLEMERQRFPSTLELITGKFPRHSKSYYRWRIDDRRSRVLSDQQPELYDDLAVAYDKLGKHEKAIETALECELLFPGRYETAANLGTFHIHAGNFHKGLEYISLALEINPNAHFGRERYQKLLVEYLLSKQSEGRLLFPLDSFWPKEEFYAHQPRGFAKYCQQKVEDGARRLDDDELIAEALKGIQGMMRFGQHDSPVLLEALGDLLLAGHRDTDAKRLAARAYLRSAEACTEAKAVTAYRDLAAKALEIHVAHDAVGMPPYMSLEKLESILQVEIKDAEEWYVELEKREENWIASGDDVDTEFWRTYYKAPPPVTKSPEPDTYGELMFRRIGLAIAGILAVVCVGVFVLRKLFIMGRTRTGHQT